MDKVIIGAIEKVDLPDLLIEGLHARVDTGAATSSLHVDNIEPVERDGKEWVNFDIHPDIHNVDRVVRKSAKIKAKRIIKSSTATAEHRYVIETTIVLASQRWNIEITLTDRSTMTYLMLFGREAMNDRFLVDPSSEYKIG